MRLTGARILMECLRAEGVEVFFGYPGGVVLPLYNTLGEYPDIKHVLVRHEQAAAHAADGYARVAGRTGVCLATSGPGATNLVTGITTAYMDSVPMVVLTGNVARDLIGRDGFQEADITGITLPITKHNYLLMRASEIAPAVKEAFHIASTGRKGPVLVDIPKDVFIEEAEWDGYPQGVSLRGYPIMDVPREEEVAKAAETINAAHKPIVIAGHGVVQSEAQNELVEFAERSDTPVLTTLLGISGMPEEHELSYGFLGMHGHFYANMAADRADVVIGIGMRFDDRAMGRFSDFNPTAKIVHIDIDPAEIGKNFKTHAPVNGDVKETLSRLLPQIEQNSHPEWRAEIDQIMDQHPTDYIEEGTGLGGPWLVQAIAEATQGQSTIVTGVGQHQMWAAQYYPYNKARQWVTSGGLGTMGYEVPSRDGRPVRPGRTNLVNLRRRRLPDDFAGTPDRRRPQLARPLRHLQQRIPRHGPPMAGTVLRQQLSLRRPGPARLCQARRGLRHQRRPRDHARRSITGLPRPRGLRRTRRDRLPARARRKRLANGPGRRSAFRDHRVG